MRGKRASGTRHARNSLQNFQTIIIIIIIIIIILLLIKNTYYSRAGPRIAMLV